MNKQRVRSMVGCILIAGIAIIGSNRVASASSLEWISSHPDAVSVILATDKTSYKLGSDILVKIQQRNGV